jgi:hypothetical protein
VLDPGGQPKTKFKKLDKNVPVSAADFQIRSIAGELALQRSAAAV